MSRLGEAREEARPRRLLFGPARSLRRRGPDEGGRPPELPAMDAGVDSEAMFSPVWEILPRGRAVAEMPGMLSMLRRDAVFRRTAAVSDIAAGYVALLLALGLIAGAPLGLAPLAVLIAPFIVLVAKALGLYDGDQHRLRKTSLDEAPTLAYLAFLFGIALWLGEAPVIGASLSRGQVVSMIVLSFILTMGARAAARATVLRLTAPERCLLVGNAGEIERIEDKLGTTSGVNATVVARLAVARFTGPAGSAHDSGSLPSLLRRHGVERVIIAAEGQDEEEILQCVRLVKAYGVKVSVLPRLLEVVGSSSVFDDVDGTTLLGVRPYGLSKSSEILKRLTDVVGAGLALLTLAPLLAMVAIVIQLDSKGSPFYRARRVGRRGESFSMLKFRTMVDRAAEMKSSMHEFNEVDGGLFKIADDPRITRVGRILRRTSLDELPQLINVLRGDMSLVGPRPLEPDEDELVAGWGRRRLAVPPGMTGLWQIFGSSRIPMHEMVKIDYLYGANWSIWLDLKILLRTVPYVLGRRGI